jgi:hypothetical protein
MNGSFIGYCFITVLEKKKEAVLLKIHSTVKIPEQQHENSQHLTNTPKPIE